MMRDKGGRQAIEFLRTEHYLSHTTLGLEVGTNSSLPRRVRRDVGKETIHGGGEGEILFFRLDGRVDPS
jgi:hypothetical protein